MGVGTPEGHAWWWGRFSLAIFEGLGPEKHNEAVAKLVGFLRGTASDDKKTKISRTRQDKKMNDGKEITRALRAFFAPGEVFEIRVLGAVSMDYRREHIESGYFDYEHIDEVPGALSQISKYKGIYVTANPCKPELLARAAYKVTSANSRPTTTDTEILKRKWLLVDCDAQRSTGISSSDEEHQAALETAKSIRESLKDSMGWPEPIWTDSGNGSQLMYRIDLPSDDGGLVQRILHALSQANDDRVNVDISVFNPARIWRLPGTMNCKGDSIPSRPHRMAHIIEMPNRMETVTTDMLEDVAEYSQEEEHPQTMTAFCSTGTSFDIDQWIASHCNDIGQPRPYRGGRKWVFGTCPFNSEHTDRSAVIVEGPDGRVGFKCHHNSCQGNDWHALRMLLDSEYRDRQNGTDTQNYDGIDISGIIASGNEPKVPEFRMAKEENIKEEEEPPAPIDESDKGADTLPFPESLYDIPGIIGDVMKTTLKYASIPNRPLALAGALTLMSYITARKIKTPSGLRPNIYILALAQSGCGKERPRDINQQIIESLGLDKGLLDDIASGEGLEDALLDEPALFWQCDEFYSTLHNMSMDATDTKNTVMKYLLKLYTNSHKNMRARSKVGRAQAVIGCPHLTLLATTTPHGFFEHLTERFLIDGMYARLNILVAEPPARGKLTDEPVISTQLMEKCKKWKDFQPAGSGNLDNAILAVPYTDAGMAAAEDMRNCQNDEYDALVAKGEDAEWKYSVWNRACEIGLRYALLYAASVATSPERTVIDEKAIAWGKAFSWWEIKNKIHMTERKYFKSSFEANAEFVMQVMQRWHSANGETPMSGWQFNRKMKHLDPKTLNQVVESLGKQKRLIVTNTKSGGATYALPGAAKGEKADETEKQ